MGERLAWAAMVTFVWLLGEAIWAAVIGEWQITDEETRAVIACLVIAVLTFPKQHKKKRSDG